MMHLVEMVNPRANIFLAWGFFLPRAIRKPDRNSAFKTTGKGGSMLENTVKKIGPLNQSVMAAAKQHHGLLALPADSLGRFHELAIKMAGIMEIPRPEITDTAIITMAGDHGVAAQGVSKFPQAVTREMVANFARGGAAINVFARHVGARLTVVNMGVAGGAMALTVNRRGNVRYEDHALAPGTGDISMGPAMTRAQAIEALETGIRVFADEKARGLDAVGTGDMGIANTTASSAIAAVLLNKDPARLVNRGTGIDDAALENKIRVVARAIQVNRPDLNDPVDVLAKVGGFEIGGIAGVILGACAHRVPVVVDGFISTAAALLASRFHPDVKHYLFGGHLSAVEGHRLMLEDLGIRPLLDLDMRLGEGTGAALGLSLLVAASRVATDMLTFEEAAVSESAIPSKGN
jgi:nicotinate-nucleotide--dimethylbenzimidazole phosphoribosyltransferase